MRNVLFAAARRGTAATTGLLVVTISLSISATYASDLDAIGVSLLRLTTTNLDGSGLNVGQVEVSLGGSPPPWEVNPSVAGVALPVSRFTFRATGSTSGSFPNSLGAESGHADAVAACFYGLWGGVSTNVAHIDNFEANYFYFTVVPSLVSINDRIVNQSFVASSSDQSLADVNYDNYAAQYGTLFVSGAGNGGVVCPPSTAYNSISVAAYGGASSVGPTPDNGRAKPDITAPGGATSYSTPLVSGGAAILLQAALRGDGGVDTNSAANSRTLKALLLNGAVKPVDWTHTPPSPLDTRYGAGVLNVFNSYKQLTGGKSAFVASNAVPTGGAHPPTSSTNNIGKMKGWDYNTLYSSSLNDSVAHYCFNLTNSSGGAPFAVTATLVWNRQFGQNNINDLNLYLYDMSNGTLVASSVSTVDNVEHIYIPQLQPGRYDLQVLKKGGVTVSAAEPYALAFEFISMPLDISFSGSTAILTWPVYPAGFALESATAPFVPLAWNPVNITPVVTNYKNRVVIDSTDAAQVFRLRRKP